MPIHDYLLGTLANKVGIVSLHASRGGYLIQVTGMILIGNKVLVELVWDERLLEMQSLITLFHYFKVNFYYYSNLLFTQQFNNSITCKTSLNLNL